jgi:hypothetical protein
MRKPVLWPSPPGKEEGPCGKEVPQTDVPTRRSARALSPWCTRTSWPAYPLLDGDVVLLDPSSQKLKDGTHREYGPLLTQKEQKKWRLHHMKALYRMYTAVRLNGKFNTVNSCYLCLMGLPVMATVFLLLGFSIFSAVNTYSF